MSSPGHLRPRSFLPGLALLLAAVLSTTCDGLDNIEIPAGGETTIEGSVLGDILGQLDFVGFDGIDISQSQEFRNKGYTKNQIDSVRLVEFKLTVTAPSDGNFDFLSRISFFAEAPGVESVEIARLDPVPEGQSVLEMEILDADLVDHAVAESMTITTSATGTMPGEDTTIRADVLLDVEVDVGGSLGCRAAAALR